MVQQIMDKLFVAYEKLMCEHHKKATGQETWHWRDVPDNVLVASGWRHNLNLLRHTRLQHIREGVPMEYGLDGISFDGKHYHGLQAKCWKENSRLCANDIGTFLSVLLNRFRTKHPNSKGYLYTKANLEINLREDIENSGCIETIQLNYPEQQPEEKTIKKEKFQLRNYQVEAINALNTARQEGENNGWLSMPCGTGKTSCYGEFARHFKKIIVLSPLRVSAQQNLTRLTLQLALKKRNTMLVDCDHVRDKEAIVEFWGKAENKLVSTTFKSADDLLQEVLFSTKLSEDVLVIIDEAHNRTDEMRDWITEKRGDAFVLWVSATPLPAPTEKIFFTYSWAEALNSNWICDYDLLLPIVKNVDENDDDTELNQIDKDALLMLKSRFLISGMLRLGVKRVISYCYSKNECDRFSEMLNKICCEEMGLEEKDVWLSKITEDVSGKKRDEILRNFQENRQRINVITSVRILDEAIDIPACDGVFFLRVTDRKESWIRTIQRMSRANRLDEKNPSKRARVFLWLDNGKHERLPKCLEMIRDSDPEFYRKIQCIDVGAYDRQDSDDDLTEYEGNETLKRSAEYSVECLTLAELKQRKLEMCMNYFIRKREEETEDRKGEWPPTEYVEDGINIGIFWLSIRNKHTSISDEQHKMLLDLDKDYQRIRVFDKATTAMKTPEKIVSLCEYIVKHGEIPQRKTKTTWNIGSFSYSVKAGNIKLTDEQRQMILKVAPTFFDLIKPINKDARNWEPEQRIDAVLEHHTQTGSIPLTDYIRPDGVRLGRICRDLRCGRIKLNNEQRKRLLDIDPNFFIIRTIHSDAKNLSKMQKLEMCKKYHDENDDKWPPQTYRTENGFRLGTFWNIRYTLDFTEEERLYLVKIEEEHNSKKITC